MMRSVFTVPRCLSQCGQALIFFALGLACSVSIGQEQPNIILINLDDADAELFERQSAERLFPNIMELGRTGITFRNFHVTTPLCGPSRACLYRGQYAHNTGFYVNQSRLRGAHHFEGGFKFYREKGYFENDLSTWMKDAGYRTMLVGKFLHHDFERYVPPGWDDYYVYRGARYYGAYTFTNRNSPEGAASQTPKGLYRTTSETQDAIELITRHVARDNGKPFFLNVNPIGPHRAQLNHPEMIDRKMRNRWTKIRQPPSPAYDESDISDKRGFFTGHELLNKSLHEFARRHYRERVLATRSVDDMVGSIVRVLKKLGVEDQTYLIVTSDNGFLMGHHRVFGKGIPADRATRVPLLVKGPDTPAGIVADHLIGHIDLAPTIVELAGKRAPKLVDGISFAELLTKRGLDRRKAFRSSLLIENWFDISNMGHTSPAASNTLRLPNAMYTEWANGDRDYYDLTRDPHQLTNTYDELDDIDRLLLEDWLRSLKNPAKFAKARFSVPFESSEMVARGGELFGLAEDPVGVSQVRLMIQQNDTRQFWNGAAWQSEPVLVDANLDGPGHQLTFWRYRLSRTLSGRPGAVYSSWVWASDQEGDFDWPSHSTFQLDNESPTIKLCNPRPGRTVTGDVSFDGTATDNLAIGSIELLIRDLETNKYWDGEKFQARRVFTSVTPNRRNKWKYSAKLPSGTYGVRVLAKDTSGNQSKHVGRRFFVGD